MSGLPGDEDGPALNSGRSGYRIYQRRWLFLLVVSLLSCSNATVRGGGWSVWVGAPACRDWDGWALGLGWWAGGHSTAPCPLVPGGASAQLSLRDHSIVTGAAPTFFPVPGVAWAVRGWVALSSWRLPAVAPLVWGLPLAAV